MHILTIQDDRRALKQGVVRIDWPRLEFDPTQPSAALHRRFLELFCQAADLWQSLPIVSACVRMRVSPSQPPTSWHAITTETGNEAPLRLAMAAFMRLDGMDGATVTTPMTVDDYKTAFIGAEDGWLTFDRTPAASSAGGQIFVGISLFASLGDLFAKAMTLGYPVDYQAALMPLRPSAGLIREVMKSAAFLRRETRAPQALVDRQSEIARDLAGARALVDEAVRTSPEGRGWLADYLANAAARALPLVAADDAEPVRPLDDERASALAYHVHPDVLLGSDGAADALDSVDGFMTLAAAAERLRCEPFWRTAGLDALRPLDSPITALFSTISSRLPPGPGSAAAGHAPPGGDGGGGGNGRGGRFMFVSYAHRDRARVAPVLDALGRDGVRLWIDSEIHVGEEWDTRLEAQLTACAGLIAFVSGDYAASKHCRRELKFADALDKPILASSFGSAPLTGGLGYIFASLQFVAGSETDVTAALIRAIGGRCPRRSPPARPGGIEEAGWDRSSSSRSRRLSWRWWSSSHWRASMPRPFFRSCATGGSPAVA